MATFEICVFNELQKLFPEKLFPEKHTVLMVFIRSLLLMSPFGLSLWVSGSVAV